MRSLESVAKVINSPPSEETGRALANALQYFHEAAPKHTADEEESLFPRLRKLKSPEVESAFSRLEDLESEHRWAEPVHVQVETLGLEYLEKGRLSATQVAEFRSAVSQLSAMYQRHIAVEDQALFPVAAKVLSGDEKQAIAAEMAKRREVSLVPIGGMPVRSTRDPSLG